MDGVVNIDSEFDNRDYDNGYHASKQNNRNNVISMPTPSGFHRVSMM